MDEEEDGAARELDSRDVGDTEDDDTEDDADVEALCADEVAETWEETADEDATSEVEEAASGVAMEDASCEVEGGAELEVGGAELEVGGAELEGTATTALEASTAELEGTFELAEVEDAIELEDTGAGDDEIASTAVDGTLDAEDSARVDAALVVDGTASEDVRGTDETDDDGATVDEPTVLEFVLALDELDASDPGRSSRGFTHALIT